MHEHRWPWRTGASRLASLGLIAAVVVAPWLAGAATFTVDTLDDGDVDDEGTFRWAVEQANNNGAAVDTIDFDPDLIDDPDNHVIQIILESAPLEITSELVIDATTLDLTDPSKYFVDIVRDRAFDDEFVVTQNLKLINADLRSNAMIVAGGDDNNNTIDLVYDVQGATRVVDVFSWLFESTETYALVKPARVVKDGDGELALLLETDGYTGGTLLVDGSLRTDTVSLQGDVHICANNTADEIDEGFTSDSCDDALLIFEMPSVLIDPDPLRTERAADGTYAGNITGNSVGGEDGHVLKTGAGTLTLTGDNNYDGGTYLLEGGVSGDTDAIQGDIHICPGIVQPGWMSTELFSLCNASGAAQAQLTFDIPADSSFADALSGQGIVTKTGSAQLTLGGDNSGFAGDVQIDDGQLVVDNTLGTFGTGTVDVTVNSGGTLSGTGTVNGDVDVTGGTLSSLTTIDGDVDVNANGTVSGSGTITGTVDVNSGGTLSGSRTINGNVDVDSGGRIEGALTLAANLDLRGTLDLTDEDMEAAGDVTIDDGSVIVIELDNSPGELIADGDVTLKAAAVDVQFDLSAIPTTTTRYFTVIRSASATPTNTLTGTLSGGENGDGILLENAIFELILRNNDTANCGAGFNVCLESTFSPVLQDDAETDNQRAIASALDQAYACAQNPNLPECMIDQNTADDFNSLYMNFSVPAEDLPAIFDALAGDEYAAFSDVRSAASARFNRSISRRFDLEMTDGVDGDDSSPQEVGDVSAPGLRWEALGASARNYRDRRDSRMAWRPRHTQQPMAMNRHAGRGGLTGWMDIHGVMGELGGSSNADDIDYRIYGPLFGVDYGVSESITVGVTMGYTRNEMKTPGTGSKGRGNTYQGGAYVGAVLENFYLTSAVRYAYSDLETRRNIRFGNLARTATADFDASDTSVFFEAAYAPPLPDVIPANVAIQPMVALGYNHLYQGAFDESQAGSLDLEIDRQEIDTVQTSVGVRVGMLGRDSDDRYLRPQLRVAYEREWLDRNRSVSARLPSAGGGGAFSTKGAALARDRAILGVSSEVGVSDRLNLFVDYDLRASKDFLEHSLALGLRALW